MQSFRQGLEIWTGEAIEKVEQESKDQRYWERNKSLKAIGRNSNTTETSAVDRHTETKDERRDRILRKGEFAK